MAILESDKYFGIVNPKLSGADTSRSFYRYYAGYSADFVRSALHSMGATPFSRILDPWNGSGTTTRVAYEFDMVSVGFDVNPVMTVVARARSAATPAFSRLEVAARAVLSETAEFHEGMADDALTTWFRAPAAQRLRTLQKSILAYFGVVHGGGEITPLQLPDTMDDLCALLYLALFKAVRGYLTGFRGSNPTWIKRPYTPQHRICPSARSIEAAFMAEVETLARLSAACSRQPVPRPSICTASSTKLPLSNDTMDFVVTSPPYCTRLDYTMATLPELAVLGLQIGTDVQRLRSASMGAPVILPNTGTISESWGEECNQLLRKIQSHKSKASASYYFKNIAQYFDMLCISLGELTRTVRPGGGLAIVVQDSFYKDIHIQLPSIVSDMLRRDNHWILSEQVDFGVAKNILGLNSKSKAYRAGDSAQETVLIFTRRS